DSPHVAAIRPLIWLTADTREDTEPGQQRLNAANQVLTDHVHGHESGPLTLGDIALCLEQTPEIRGNNGKRSRKQAIRNTHPRVPGTKVPRLDEIIQALAVQADTPTVKALVLGHD